MIVLKSNIDISVKPVKRHRYKALHPFCLRPCQSTHLRVREAQRGRDLVPVRRGQILLVQEPLLELEDLRVGEGGPRFPLLLWLGPVREQVQMGLLWVNKEREREENNLLISLLKELKKYSKEPPIGGDQVQ